MTISLNDNVKIPDEVLSTVVGDEMVLLNLKTGTYFGFDTIGARFFQLLAETDQLGTIHGRMMEEFDVPADRLEQDLLRLSEQMVSKGLLAVEEQKV